MPIKRAFINFFHYWILFGFNIGLELFHFYKPPKYSNTVVSILFVTWALFEFLNLQCHITLSKFRKDVAEKSPSSPEFQSTHKRRGIPFGYGFDYASSANYFWESCAWIVFSMLTRCYTAYFFTICSVIQMLIWAKEKHRRYKKEFGDKYPKHRKAMIPFII